MTKLKFLLITIAFLGIGSVVPASERLILTDEKAAAQLEEMGSSLRKGVYGEFVKLGDLGAQCRKKFVREEIVPRLSDEISGPRLLISEDIDSEEGISRLGYVGACEAIAKLATTWDESFAQELLLLLEPMKDNFERPYVCYVYGVVAAHFEEPFARRFCDALAEWAKDDSLFVAEVPALMALGKALVGKSQAFVTEYLEVFTSAPTGTDGPRLNKRLYGACCGLIEVGKNHPFSREGIVAFINQCHSLNTYQKNTLDKAIASW